MKMLELGRLLAPNHFDYILMGGGLSKLKSYGQYMKRKNQHSRLSQVLRGSLARPKVFCGVLLGIAVAGWLLYASHQVRAAELCAIDPMGSRTIDTVVPNKGPIGAENLEIAITGCGLSMTDDTFRVVISPTVKIDGVNIDQYPSGDRETILVQFTLAEPNAVVGVHDIEVEFPRLIGPPTATTTKLDSFTIYAPDIVGWGWYGTASGSFASPGWKSLNCKTDIQNGNPDTCYDESTGTGVAYGLGLYGETPTRSEIRGYAWLGVSQDDDTNPNNALPLGWVQFNPSGPYPDPVGLDLPGTTADQVYLDPTTDQVHGWARSLTLQKYGSDIQCSVFDPRTWASPLRLVDGNVGSQAKIASGPNEEVHAVWVRQFGPAKIYYRKFANGAWQGSSVNISDAIGAGTPTHPDIAVDNEQVIHVVFEDTSASPHKLRYAYCDNFIDDCSQAIHWHQTVFPANTQEERAPSIAVTPNSTNITVMVAFLQGNGVDTTVASYVKSGVSWNGPDPATTSITAGEPRAEADFENNFHVVWEDSGAVQYRKYDSGIWLGSSETELTPIEAAEDYANPDVSSDPSGGVHVVYDTNKWSARDIGYLRYSATGGWTELQRLTSLGDRNNPTIAVSDDYRRHVLFQRTTGQFVNHIEAAMGENWSQVSTAAASNYSRPELAVSPLGVVHSIFQSTLNSRIYNTNSNDLVCQGGAPASDWGWISTRGGVVDPVSLGAMRSCYDCTGPDCKICEIDDSYNADNNPPLYACNQCTSCGTVSKCRRSGEDCTADPNICPNLGGAVNDCTPVCDQCATCNLWGLSVEGVTGDEGRFHGFAWSAGGSIPVDPSYPAGGYDSGNLQIENNITDATDGCADGTPCVCTNLGECQSWGLLSTDADSRLRCPNRFSLEQSNIFGTSGWGACRLRQGSIEYMTLPVDVPEEGNYFLSVTAVYDGDEDGVSVITTDTNGNQATVTGTDLSDDANPQVIPCTYSKQLYLKDGDTFRFEPIGEVVQIDSYRITKMPVHPIDCLTGANISTAFVNEAGFGWADFSDVSLVKPWTETVYGDIYSRGSIGETGGEAPAGAYNSNYLIETAAGGTITWTTPSDQSLREGTGSEIFLPAPGAGYRNILGRIDYDGLIRPQETNPYSSRVIDTFIGDDCSDEEILWSNIENEVYAGVSNGVLSGGIYHIGQPDQYCKLVIDGPDVEFKNGAFETDLGKGLFIVEGDLEIRTNLIYDSTNISRITQLASVGWLVKGDIIVDPAVTEIVGAYVALGCDPSGNCPGTPGHQGTFFTGLSSTETFTLQGLVLAKSFELQRTSANVTSGSERFINDGKVRANPPPGMTDFTAGLPVISAVRP